MKIAILMPVYMGVHRKTVSSLVELIEHTRKALPEAEIEYINTTGSILLHSRTWLIEEAERRKVDWALWVDADMTFPPDALVRLLAHGLDFVGTNYRRRGDGEATTAGLDLWGIETTREKAEAGTLEEAKKISFGFCLISMNVLRRIRELATERGGQPYPLFQFEPSHKRFLGEDNFFGFKAREAGFQLWVDHSVTWDIGHIGEREWRYDDASAAPTAAGDQ